jgi:hypothetical protein
MTKVPTEEEFPTITAEALQSVTGGDSAMFGAQMLQQALHAGGPAPDSAGRGARMFQQQQ